MVEVFVLGSFHLLQLSLDFERPPCGLCSNMMGGGGGGSQAACTCVWSKKDMIVVGNP